MLDEELLAVSGKQSADIRTVGGDEDESEKPEEDVSVGDDEDEDEIQPASPRKSGREAVSVPQEPSFFEPLVLRHDLPPPGCTVNVWGPLLFRSYLPKEHRAKWFLTANLCSAFNSIAKRHASRLAQYADESSPWDNFLLLDNLQVQYFAVLNLELSNRGYTIVEGVADWADIPHNLLSPLCGLPEVSRLLKKRSVRALFEFVEKSFPGERQVITTGAATGWHTIANTAVDKTDRASRRRGTTRFQCNTRLLCDIMETDENVWLAQTRAFLDFYVCTFMKNIAPCNYEDMAIPKTGGRFLMTGKGCLPQTGHNDFPHTLETNSPGYFAIVTMEETGLYVCDFSNQFVFSSDAQKKHLVQGLAMTHIIIPANSIFFGHGHLQHAGDGYRGSRCLRYHIYFAPTGYRIGDSISFAYNDSLPLDRPFDYEYNASESESEDDKGSSEESDSDSGSDSEEGSDGDCQMGTVTND